MHAFVRRITDVILFLKVWMIPPDREYPQWFDKLPRAIKAEVLSLYNRLFQPSDHNNGGGHLQNSMQYRAPPNQGSDAVNAFVCVMCVSLF